MRDVLQVSTHSGVLNAKHMGFYVDRLHFGANKNSHGVTSEPAVKKFKGHSIKAAIMQLSML